MAKKDIPKKSESSNIISRIAGTPTIDELRMRVSQRSGEEVKNHKQCRKALEKKTVE